MSGDNQKVFLWKLQIVVVLWMYLLVLQWLFIKISSSCDHVQKPEGPILEALLSDSTEADKEAVLAALKQLNGHNCVTIFTIVWL